MLIDVALYRLGVGPNYVLDEPDGRAGGIQLLKLHGSVNWATETESRKIRPLHLKKYYQAYPATQMSEGGPFWISKSLVSFFSRHEKIEVDPEPVIVPPSWNKTDYHQALSAVWELAAKHLSEARTYHRTGLLTT